MRALVGCVVLALSFSAIAAGQDTKIDGKKLIGKWKVKDDKKAENMVIEFSKDGKLSLAAEILGKPEKIDGTYKLDGDKLDVTMKFGGEEKKETLTVKKLTDTELETTDSKGKSDSFTRIEEKKEKKK